MATNILFWNTNKQPLTHNIARIVGTHDIHIVLLAESGFVSSPSDLTDELNRTLTRKRQQFIHVSESISGPKVQVFSRLQKSKWRVMREHSRYTIWRVEVGADDILFLAAVHFPDVRYEQGDGQRKTAVDLKIDIDSIEAYYIQKARKKAYEGAPLLVIGDFNASPFDAGISSVYGLNANQRRAVVREGSRILEGKSYPFLYNPMWQFYGAGEARPPGTYYNRLSKPVCFDWYILDQVMVRPKLLPYLSDSDVSIIDHDGIVPLVTEPDKRPDTNLSDHLPLLVRLKL